MRWVSLKTIAWSGLWGAQRDLTTRRLAEQALQRRTDQLASLNRIGAAISTLKDIRGVLQEALDQLQPVLPLDVFYVAMYDEQTGGVSYPLLYDSERYWEQPSNLVEPGMWLYQVIRTRRPLLLNRTPQEVEQDSSRRNRPAPGRYPAPVGLGHLCAHARWDPLHRRPLRPELHL